ncbi:MAG TPA: FtsW/RodA/SpoVE family cell cycle protein [Clostridiales bacterium]|nr:FtsW/RodA/SpoVE family cell cycle protein [Clostridiales bacterium]
MKNFIATLKRAVRDTDILLLTLCIITSTFGALMVYSATIIDIAEGARFSRDFRTMVLAVSVGLFIAIVVSFIDYVLIIKAWPVIAAVCIGLMVAVFIFGVGPSGRQDAKTWLVLGSTGLYFQPSELVKIGFIITFGMHLELVHDQLNELKNIILLALHAAVPTVLVIISGDLGSALVFMLIFIAMMYLSGVKLKYFGIGAALVAIVAPFAWKFLLKDLQKERFLALINPEDYPNVIYQQKMGITAIGAGKLTGMGLFNGRYTQSDLIPENENDMIFSAIGEELGFIGCLLALILLLLIVLRLINIGKKAGDRAAQMMCYGLAAMIVAHTVINVGMCLMLLPVVGITLPFFSAGGSSNLCLYIGIGLALSIYRHSREHEAVNFKLSGIRTPFTE